MCQNPFYLTFLNWIEIILSHYERKGRTEGQAYVGAPPVITTQSTASVHDKIDTGTFLTMNTEPKPKNQDTKDPTYGV